MQLEKQFGDDRARHSSTTGDDMEACSHRNNDTMLSGRYCAEWQGGVAIVDHEAEMA